MIGSVIAGRFGYVSQDFKLRPVRGQNGMTMLETFSLNKQQMIAKILSTSSSATYKYCVVTASHKKI